MTTRAKRTAKPRQIEALIGSDHELLKRTLAGIPPGGVGGGDDRGGGGRAR